MKHVILLQSFLALMSLSFSQSYHPIIEPNKYWDEGVYINQDPCYVNAIRIEFTDDDTLVNGYYYRIYNSYNLFGEPGPGGTICPPFTSDTIPIRQIGLREDTANRKVYAYDPTGNPTDILIYDFSLSVGDTLYYDNTGGYYQVLEEIEEIVLLNGETRKKYWFDNHFAYYIEGIGGMNGLFMPIIPLVGGGYTRFCVKHFGEDIFGDQCNTYFVGANILHSDEILISPNPVRDLVHIELMNFQRQVSFDIFNFNGTKVFSTYLDNQSNSVSLVNLLQGIYFYVIQTETTKYSGKLIKI